MNFEAVKDVLSRSRSTGTDRVVLLALAINSNDSYECSISSDELAKAANVCIRTLRYSLIKLEKSSEIELVRGMGRGNLSSYRITVSHLPLLKHYRRTAKSNALLERDAAIARRRRHYQSIRDALFLKMLKAGVDYQCAHPECGIREDLTIDHIIAIANGGTDEVSNLQFLCKSHNSAKGARE